MNDKKKIAAAIFLCAALLFVAVFAGVFTGYMLAGMQGDTEGTSDSEEELSLSDDREDSTSDLSQENEEAYSDNNSGEDNTQKTEEGAMDTEGSGSAALTRDILTSHSWYVVMQSPCEFIFYNDGTYESYGMGYYTGRYTIEGNTLHMDDFSYEYTSLEEDQSLKNDTYFMSIAENLLHKGEKFFYSYSHSVWLIDASGRHEADKDYCIYRNFALDIQYNWDISAEDYVYRDFGMVDIDENGVKELVVHEGTCEQDRKYHFYTIENKKIISIGSVSAWHSGLCDNDGCLTRYDGMGGEGTYYKITVENGKISEKQEGTYSFPPVPDFGEGVKFFSTMY